MQIVPCLLIQLIFKIEGFTNLLPNGLIIFGLPIESGFIIPDLFHQCTHISMIGELTIQKFQFVHHTVLPSTMMAHVDIEYLDKSLPSNNPPVYFISRFKFL